MLEVSNIEVTYRRVPVIRDVSFRVSEGEIVAVVGSNGAGKSTLLRAISGLKAVSKGEIRFLGESIEREPAYKVARKGLCLIPEGAKVFSKLSVKDNLLLGTFAKRPGHEVEKLSQAVFEMFPALAERKNLNADTLSGGERQMLAIGRAMMSQPNLMMMDEPTAGLSPILAEQVFTFINELRARGLTILLVEQQVEHALETADRAYVLENGEILMEGPAREVMDSDTVRKAYLGL